MKPRASSPLLLLLFFLLQNTVQSYAPTCSVRNEEEWDQDPALQTIEFDLGYGREYFDVYVPPDVSTFYRKEAGMMKTKRMSFRGLAGKFVNMSPDHVKLYWDANDGNPNSISLISIARPFESVGTSTFPNHLFFFAPNDSHTTNTPPTRLHEFHIQVNKSVYYYDPITVPHDSILTQRNIEMLTLEEYEKYERHSRNRKFEEIYRGVTGREYLGLFPRKKPMHRMWRADYYGQEHWVETKETYFERLPREGELGKIGEVGKKRKLGVDEPRLLSQYRNNTSPTLNLTLKVLSCNPRVFEIQDFLSSIEINHILKLATGMDLSRSSTSGGSINSPEENDANDGIRNTRTSFNSWVYREESPIVDAIYRRAADVIQIDESLLRKRSRDEVGGGEEEDGENLNTLAEALQLVHYDKAQEYTAHHDFGYPDHEPEVQAARFLTLLLYLNEGMDGGETEFPRWANAETTEGLKVVPKAGKAVLFYSQLPDGNLDDLSQHAALPVGEKGEKWLINLWVWDPIYDR